MATILENVHTLSVHLEDAYTALEGKGATIPQQKNATNLSATVDSLPAAGFTIDDLLATASEPQKDIVINVTEVLPANSGGNNALYGGMANLFRSRPNFVKSVDFPNLQKIGGGGCANAFAGQRLQEVKHFCPTTLEQYACESMFSGCNNLTSFYGPLSAATVPTNGYSHMFMNCSSLSAALDALPATNLGTYCYQFMFSGCSQLTSVPTLPPLPLVQGICYSMFQNCTALENQTITLKLLPGETVPSFMLNNMFNGAKRSLRVVLDFTDFQQVPALQAATGVNVFNNTADGRLEIRVPEALEADWKIASNWSQYASRIVGV